MRIKRLEEYLKQEAEDLQIDKNSLSKSLSNLPNLHSKWLRYYYEEQEKLLMIEKKRRKLFREKHEFYKFNYEMQLKDNQLIYYIEADKEYTEILLKYDIQRKIVEFLDTVIKKIRDQNFIIRNLIEWERYKLGL
jgi:hypothetical protein